MWLIFSKVLNRECKTNQTKWKKEDGCKDARMDGWMNGWTVKLEDNRVNILSFGNNSIKPPKFLIFKKGYIVTCGMHK